MWAFITNFATSQNLIIPKNILFCLFQPPVCDAATGTNLALQRRKRQTVELDETRGVLYDTDREDLKVKVYSGLYVNEASDLEDDDIDDAEKLVSCTLSFFLTHQSVRS